MDEDEERNKKKKSRSEKCCDAETGRFDYSLKRIIELLALFIKLQKLFEGRAE
jgi:hypothetical protein